MIGGSVHSKIGKGFLVLLGIHKSDTENDVAWIARKIVNMRVFEDDAGQMNTDLAHIDGEIMVISQFTLIASTKKGNRPSFNDAATPELGKQLYEATVSAIQAQICNPVATGVFAADMKVSLVNDGPVTITLDTHYKE